MIRAKKKIGKLSKTERGFEVVHFADHYGVPCSLQMSSLAICAHPGTSAIWLGTDDLQPKVLHGDAARLGVKTDATSGWVPYPIPPEVLLSSRMHLTRKQVEKLVPRLQAWLDTGSFR